MCTRQEQLLQLINETYATLDSIFYAIDNEKESLIHIQNNPAIIDLMQETVGNVKLCKELVWEENEIEQRG